MTCTIVCGPPCAGKSTYVEQNAEPGDLIVDADDIAYQLGSGRTHGHTKPYWQAAEVEVERLLSEIEAGLHERSWVIRAAPYHEQRQKLLDRIPDATVVMLIEPRDVLIERAMERRNPERTVGLIDWWLSKYEPTAAPTDRWSL